MNQFAFLLSIVPTATVDSKVLTEVEEGLAWPQREFNQTVNCELLSTDIIKTDSLAFPVQASVVVSTSRQCKSTNYTGSDTTTQTYRFGFSNGRWQAVSGMARMESWDDVSMDSLDPIGFAFGKATHSLGFGIDVSRAQDATIPTAYAQSVVDQMAK